MTYETGRTPVSPRRRPSRPGPRGPLLGNVRKIRHRGFAGLGGAESCGPNQVWDPKVTVYGLPPGQCVPKPAAPAATDSGGIGGFLRSIGSALFGQVTTQAKAEGQSAAYQAQLAAQQGTPGWVLPVVIGGVGLAAVLLLMPPRK